MASLKAIRTRIRSIKSTEKITRAMKMVAAARLRRSQDQAVAARPYEHLMKEVLGCVAERVDLEQYPLFKSRDVKCVEIVAITSDRGLCGGFNSAIEKKVRQLTEDAKGQDVALRIIGKKGTEFFKRREIPIRKSYVGLLSSLKFSSAQEIAVELMMLFNQGRIDQVILVYNEFVSAVSQRVVEHQLIPIVCPDNLISKGNQAITSDYIYEPNASAILEDLLPRYVTNQMWEALIESLASENAARMTAMDAATTNAGEMIGKLTIQMNRTRQAAITSELVEIVSGAEALK